MNGYFMSAPAPENGYIAPVSAVIARAPGVIALPAPKEYIASIPIVYATSAPVAEYTRRRQPEVRSASVNDVYIALTPSVL